MLFRRFCRRTTAFVSFASEWGNSFADESERLAVSARRWQSIIGTGSKNVRSSNKRIYGEKWAQDVAAHMEIPPLPEGVTGLSEDDADFINVELRSLLIGKGEVPISAVPPHLSERARDLLSKIGGIGTFVATYGKRMFATLIHSSGATLIMNRQYAPMEFVASVKSIIKRKGGNERGGPGIDVGEIYGKIPLDMKSFMNLKRQRVASCLRSHPEVFAVSEDHRFVSLKSANPRFPASSRKPIRDNIDETLGSGSHAVYVTGYNEPTKHAVMSAHSRKHPEAPMSYEARKDLNPMLHSFLVRCFPSSCFVPLSEVMKRLSSDVLSSLCGTCFKKDDILGSLMKAFSSLPSDVVDVRVLGDSPDKIFVRLVADRFTVFSGKNADDGEETFSDYNVNHLGHDIAEAFREAGCEESTINALPNILSKELLDQFPLQGPPAILVFDRMQHLFDVDNVNFAVRLRREGEPFSASMYTTPVPQAVRYFACSYAAPVSIDELAEHMPPHVTSEIFATFGSVKSFIAAHRMYVFVQEGGLVYTPAITVKEQGRRGPSSMTFKEKQTARAARLSHLKTPHSVAEHIHSILPTNRFVQWIDWSERQQDLPQVVLNPTLPDPAIFFGRFPALFKTCFPRGSNLMLIGRAELPLPKHSWPQCLGVYECLKELAWSTLGGNHEPVVFNMISREARMITRAFGGMENLCRQVPQWFEVSNRAGIQGACFITYIGHLQEDDKSAAIAEAAIKAATVENEELPKTALSITTSDRGVNRHSPKVVHFRSKRNS